MDRTTPYSVTVTTQREIAEAQGLPIHPPKVEIFDVAEGTNTDPKQRIRAVDEYRHHSWGLYLARPVAGHPELTYLESWLLPELGLRVSRWERVPGHEVDYDYYLDIVGITTGARQWRSEDYYLDITVGNGRFANLLDVDEFLVAVRAELLDPMTAQGALEVAWRTVAELAEARYVLADWLRDKGIELSWRAYPAQYSGSTPGRVPPYR